MAKDLAGVINELVEKGYNFRNVYYSRNASKFSETTSSNFSLSNIHEVFARYMKKGHNNFEVILDSEYKCAEKYYFVGMDTANKKLELKKLHYENNLDSYKGLIDIFKENGWKVEVKGDK